MVAECLIGGTGQRVMELVRRGPSAERAGGQHFLPDYRHPYLTSFHRLPHDLLSSVKIVSLHVQRAGNVGDRFYADH